VGKKYMLLRIYIGLSMSVTLKSPSRSIPNIPQAVFSMTLEAEKAHDVDSTSIRNLHSVEIVADKKRNRVGFVVLY
jgi:hypothetical protein